MNQIVLVQQPDNVMMHAFLSGITGQPIQVISDVTIGVVIKQNLSCLEATLSGCKKQGRLLLKKHKKWLVLNSSNSYKTHIFIQQKITIIGTNGGLHLIVLHVPIGSILQKY